MKKEKNMKKWIMISSLALLAMNAQAQLSKVDNKTLDVIIQRLESTGKLDEALNRVIDKKIKKEKETQARAALEQEKKNQENSKAITGFSEQDHYLGDRNARYCIIVYEDLECPYCKVYADIPESAITKLKDVNFISRPHPLEFHMPAAAKEAVLAECVAQELGNEGYFKFTRAIFKNTLTNGQGLPALSADYQLKGSMNEQAIFKELKIAEKSLFAVAKEVGVKNIEETLACYTDNKTSLKLQNILQFSMSHGITGTPTTILKDNKTNKSAMLPGIMKEEELIEKVNQFMVQ